MKKFTLPKDGGLIEAGLPNGIKHTFERIPAHIHEDEEAASKVIARKIADEINASEKFIALATGLDKSDVQAALARLSDQKLIEFKTQSVFFLTTINVFCINKF